MHSDRACAELDVAPSKVLWVPVSLSDWYRTFDRLCVLRKILLPVPSKPIANSFKPPARLVHKVSCEFKFETRAHTYQVLDMRASGAAPALLQIRRFRVGPTGVTRGLLALANVSFRSRGASGTSERGGRFGDAIDAPHLVR